MRVFVDPDICLGCGICESIAPDVFRLGPKPYAEVLLDPVPQQYWEDVKDAIEQCPEEAINLIEA